MLEEWRSTVARGAPPRVTNKEWNHLMRELPGYLTEEREWDLLFEILTDFRFLEEKIQRRNVYEVEEDFRRALRGLPELAPLREQCAALSRTLAREANTLAGAPEMVH